MPDISVSYELSTAATSAIDDSEKKRKEAKKGISIAPLPYSNFTDKQLERMIEKRFRDQAHLFTHAVVRES